MNKPARPRPTPLFVEAASRENSKLRLPVGFKEAVADLLKVKPPLKPARRTKRAKVEPRKPSPASR